jgi:hypothetical protein
MTEAQDSRGSPEHQVCNLATAATMLLGRTAAATAGRAALTLVPALCSSRRCWRLGSVQLAEHAAPGAATLQVLQGRVRLVTSIESSERDQGDHVAIPPARHRLESVEGHCRPLDRGRDTIRLRETPGNLSGSGLATHQHLSPAGASCCQSLPLDPKAMVGIDLRKRLFLLVTG